MLNFGTRQAWVQIPALPLAGSRGDVRQVIEPFKTSGSFFLAFGFLPFLGPHPAAYGGSQARG